MNSSSSSGSSGIGVFGLLGVAFVVLKLTGFISWSWWWVTIPFWGGLVLLLLGVGIYFLISYLSEQKDIRKKKLREAKLKKQIEAGVWDGDILYANKIFGYGWKWLNPESKTISANGKIYAIGDKITKD